jgi:uncharacterized protein DUF4350
MRDRHALAVAGAAAAILTVSGVVLLGVETPAAGSALSRDSRGWLAARRYLEARGCHVTLLDSNPEAAPGGGVLVLAFPWQEMGWTDVQGTTDRWLQKGGRVVFAYSGEAWEGSESTAADALDLGWEEPRGRPPLNPVQWREYAREEWWLSPEDAAAGLRPIRIGAPRRVPRMPEGARVLARGRTGLPVAFRFPRWRGHVVVLPADSFSNARIGEPGNADLLETLRADLGDGWFFDELHHGLRPPVTAAQAGPQRIFLLYLLQVLFVYVLVVVAVVHRFGPATSEPAVTTGSAATFLLGLGGLHARLGHQREAGRLLLARARELDPRLLLPDPAEGAADDLLALARRVGAAQSGKGKSA